MALAEMKHVLMYWIQGEITSFIQVWLTAYLSLSYCFFASKFLPCGLPRFFAFLPVITLFLLLPLKLHSVHLTGITGFFLPWLANFKLLTFAFGTGPLSSPSNPSLTLPKFIALACLPIKLQTSSPKQKKGHKSLSNYAIKGMLFALLLKVYDYEENIPRVIIMVLYGFHIYLCLELILAVAAAMARGLLGAELEPQFNEPYLASSLQDFWGRRWNLMVTRILRPTVYAPVLGWFEDVVGRQWAPLPAVLSTFVVSGLIHELIMFYLGRVKPTWEITLFFVLHGACLMVEIYLKKVVNGKWELPRVVATVLTVGFVIVTGLWLFLPEFLRCNAVKRGLGEVSAVGEFVKDVMNALW